jgi:8-oxo-dGTP diphosphatase
MTEALVRIVAAIPLDAAGRTLLVRKRATAAFMQPGGKLLPGEAPLAALARELFEELGCGLDNEACRSLGHFEAAAANEPGMTVRAELFSVRLLGEPRPSGEIEEAKWIDPGEDVPLVLAPLTREHAIPLARILRHEAASVK